MQFFDVRNASDVMMFASSRGKLRETPRYQNLWDLIVNNDDICFKTCASEIESNGSQILVRGEYRDESVGEEIVSQEGVEKEV